MNTIQTDQRNPQNNVPNHSYDHRDIPESSGTNNQTNLPQFSYYPEQIIEEGLKACQLSILGKIITNKPIFASSIQNGLENIWGSPAGFKIQEIEGKILQFFMNNIEDQDRILHGNPWIFRNSWLIVKPWDRETDPKSLDFDHVPVWIQLWGLPPHCKTKAMGIHLGSLMGEVEASEIYEYPGKQIIVKIRVAINVHKPIISGIHVGNPTDGTCWIDYRYERLPQICFNCGLVGHEAKLCRNRTLNTDTIAPLGPWIRSTQYGRRKMEEKDRKFYSNPSHSPNFGKYSPPVPEALIAQLAAIKLQNQAMRNNNQATPREEYKQQETEQNGNTNSTNQIVLDRKSQQYSNNNQNTEKAGKSNIEDNHQVKRLKIAFDSNTDNRINMEIQTLAGLGAQAGQKQ
ncbi:cysteine desulfurase mitochondrial-like [Trifolium pratense]|uniref:Cysteine desulfurase mitochondrial-like n=1 Tax=Trifolium pratense TaxID=57577 RepID=A0A2K3PL82_TRIPR|nr:cysteine desulfurase mitochondrial-like [Trifolium pratense]